MLNSALPSEVRIPPRAERIDNPGKTFANAAFDKKPQEVAMMYYVIFILVLYLILLFSFYFYYFNLVILHLLHC